MHSYRNVFTVYIRNIWNLNHTYHWATMSCWGIDPGVTKFCCEYNHGLVTHHSRSRWQNSIRYNIVVHWGNRSKVSIRNNLDISNVSRRTLRKCSTNLWNCPINKWSRNIVTTSITRLYNGYSWTSRGVISKVFTLVRLPGWLYVLIVVLASTLSVNCKQCQLRVVRKLLASLVVDDSALGSPG